MANNKVWVLEFSGYCTDCNGVFSTREKARAALLSHYERCKDIWNNFTQEKLEDDWELWTFVLPSGRNETALIGEYEIDLV